MHCKLVLFLLAAGYCAAAWSGTKNIRVSEDGAIIEVTTPEGKTIRIVKSRPTLDHGKAIDISVIRPDMPPRTIRIHDDSEAYGNSYDDVDGARIKRGSKSRDKSQGDIITELFNEYRGVNDEKTYEKFIKKVEKYVEKGEIDPQILNVLRELEPEGPNELLQNGDLGQGLQGQDITQGLLDRIKYGQQSAGHLSADELLRQKIIEMEISNSYREEQQARMKRLLLEEQAKEMLNKGQLGRVPLMKTPYERWSLLGSRDYQGARTDPTTRLQFLRPYEAGDQSSLLGLREDPSWRIYGQTPLSWATASERSLITPDQVRLNELLSKQQQQQLNYQQLYNLRNPLSLSGTYNWNANTPIMWQPRSNSLMGQDYSQRFGLNYPYGSSSKLMDNWQYPMSPRPYNYLRQVPVVPSQVW